jgi:DsbC/DsbD-like thiol-disulfide interchange protein
VVAPPKVVGKRGGAIEAKISIQLRDGYHVNSNTPSDDYLIPLRLTWSAAPLAAGETTYPKPQLEKYEFSEKPLSVFSGDFDLHSRFQVPAGAPSGPNVLLGKLRYQACNARACLPPKTVEVRLPVEIR